MINIPFVKKNRKEQITRNEHPILQTFAVTANAGFRRKVFEENGKFDTAFISGEDMEIYFRMLYKTSWKGLFDPSCRMYHQNRSSFSALMKQWIWYGKGHPKVFCRFGEKGIHVYYPNLTLPKSQDELHEWKALKKLITIPFYKCGFIALTPFNCFLVTLFLYITSFLLSSTNALTDTLGYAALALFSLTFFNGVKFTNFYKSLQYSFLRFSLNTCFIVTGLIQGFKMGTIFLDVSFERSSPSEKSLSK